MKNRGKGGDPYPKKVNSNHDYHVFKPFLAMPELKQPYEEDE